MNSRCAFSFRVDALLDQTDHGGEGAAGAFEGHNHNIIFGYNHTGLADGSFVFLDCAFSLGAGGRWKKGGAANCTAASFPQRMLQHLDRQVLSETVQRIEDTPTAIVDEIVGRIPSPYLESEYASEIREGLLLRRHLVRAALKDYLGVTP